MKKLTIAEIREKYSKPIVAGECNSHGEYCVGGALCLAIDGLFSDYRFPSLRKLSEAIQSYNSYIDASTAIDYAETIIRYNDAANFEGAWKTLEEVLSYVRKNS